MPFLPSTIVAQKRPKSFGSVTMRYKHTLTCALRALPRRCRLARGITLIELLATLAVAVILASVAAPSFSALIAGQRAKSAASSLYASLARARSEAMMRNAGVTIAPKNGAWMNGWQITDSRFPQNALEVRDAIPGLSITGPASLSYQRSGKVDGNSTLTFLVAAQGYASATQCISVDPGGRPYLKAAESC